MPTQQPKSREDEEIRLERLKGLKREEEIAKCNSCGKKIKKKTFWKKGRPYCCLECVEG